MKNKELPLLFTVDYTCTEFQFSSLTMTSLKPDETFTPSLDKTCKLPWKVQAI